MLSHRIMSCSHSVHRYLLSIAISQNLICYLCLSPCLLRPSPLVTSVLIFPMRTVHIYVHLLPSWFHLQTFLALRCISNARPTLSYTVPFSLIFQLRCLVPALNFLGTSLVAPLPSQRRHTGCCRRRPWTRPKSEFHCLDSEFEA